MTRMMWFSLLSGLLAVVVGCQSTCNRRPLCGGSPAPQPAFVPPPPPVPIMAPPPGPQPIQQSGGFPVLPPGALVNPPPPVNAAPQQPAPSISQFPAAQAQAQWQPTEPRDAPPRIEANREAKPRVQLYAPETLEPEKPATPEPPLQKKPGVVGSLPAIPQFVVAKENVFAGLRPKLDGLDWLQSNGVQTVVQIRLPSTDDSSDGKQVEKRNMRYIAFEVSPTTLTKEKADEFIKLMRAGAMQSMFLYDEDGGLTGAMWYLYMRLGESLNDDAAQLRAAQMGLQNNRDGLHRDMWLAVQKLISENSR